MLENELFSLLERTADAAFALSESGEIRYWNKAAERLFGYTVNEVRHKGCHEILQGIGALGTRVCREGCCVMDCANKQTEIPNFDLSVQTRSGQRLWVQTFRRWFAGYGRRASFGPVGTGRRIQRGSSGRPRRALGVDQ